MRILTCYAALTRCGAPLVTRAVGQALAAAIRANYNHRHVVFGTEGCGTACQSRASRRDEEGAAPAPTECVPLTIPVGSQLIATRGAHLVARVQGADGIEVVVDRFRLELGFWVVIALAELQAQ